MIPENPADILADAVPAPGREVAVRTVMDKYPGHISWVTDRGNISGCRCLSFQMGNVVGLTDEDALRLINELDEKGLDIDNMEPADLMNAYFSTRANLIVVNLTVDCGNIHCVISTQLDNEDLEDFMEARQAMQVAMREIQERKERLRAAQAAKLANDRRLQEVGRRAEEHNLSGRVQQLEDENKKLRQQLRGSDAAETK